MTFPIYSQLNASDRIDSWHKQLVFELTNDGPENENWQPSRALSAWEQAVERRLPHLGSKGSVIVETTGVVGLKDIAVSQILCQMLASDAAL